MKVSPNRIESDMKLSVILINTKPFQTFRKPNVTTILEAPFRPDLKLPVTPWTWSPNELDFMYSVARGAIKANVEIG